MITNRLASRCRPCNRRPAWLLAALAVLFGLSLLPQRDRAAGAEALPDHLTSRPRPTAPAVKPATLGTEVQTRAGQRRRLMLPGGPVLYVNEKTTVQLDAARRVVLSAGEVFVASPPAKNAPKTFTVKTPKDRVIGQDALFAVRASDAGTGVLVARGTARVEGHKSVLAAGQQLLPAQDRPAPAPRLSHALAWTQDLVAAADTPLVPGSKHTGGALIAIDPDGQQAKLSLRKYHVDVHVEDGFARTTIDQTYFNHEDARLEGTFYFPLPPDASLSRLAMYVDGNLMEGGMAERDYARQVYETIKYRQQDPALLEWLDGSTFKMRVFPLEPRQEKRIILSYSQKLPSLYGQVQYRFPGGHSLGRVRDWSFHARVKNGAGQTWASMSHTLRATKEDGDLLLDTAAKNARLDQDVVLTVSEKEPAATGVRFSSAEQDGTRYLMLRYRPSLPVGNRQPESGNPKTWVFLFESSGDRNPLVARTQIEIIRNLLSYANTGDTFTVLTAGTRVRPFAEEPRPVTAENAQAAIAFLEKAHLIGALDLGHALQHAQALLKQGKNPYLVHVGSGIAAMGERREDVLARRLPEGSHYIGIGVGKRWARGFMKAAAERTGGYFTQINPDEPVAWRAFELFSTLNTPRLLNVKVSAGKEGARFLTFTNMLAQGEELCAIARIGPEEKPLPGSVTVTGTLDGKEFEQVLPVKEAAEKADYLPRTWAKLEIERLLAKNAVKHKEQIIALSKAMYVMTPFTSLLVLENEDMYKQYKVDRGRKDHWAMYPAPKKIKVVHEDDPERKKAHKGKKTARQVLDTVLERDPLRFLNWPGRSSSTRTELAAQREEMRRLQHLMQRAAISQEMVRARLARLTPEQSIMQDASISQNPAAASIGQVDRMQQRLQTYREMSKRKEQFDLDMLNDTDEGPMEKIKDAGALDLNTRERIKEVAIEQRLESPISLNFKDVELGQVIDDLRDITGINVVADTAALEEASVDLHRKVSLKVDNIAMKSALTVLLQQVHLTYVIRDGVLQITTEENAHGRDIEDERYLQRVGQVIIVGNTVTPDRAIRNASGWRRKEAEVFGDAIKYGNFSLASAPSIVRTQTKAIKQLEEAKSRSDIYLSDLARAAPQDPFPVHVPTSFRRGRSLLYQRPSYSGDDRLFFDLVAYAPGMNTSVADIRAVLEAEARLSRYDRPGQIDEQARTLFAAARKPGWQRYTIASKEGRPLLTIAFDRQGRYTYVRTLPLGLREKVICDGKTLWHLYPDLGLGADRRVSRFHRLDFANLVPWAVPGAEDLAHGADLRHIGDRTVALIPHGAASKKTAGGKPVLYRRIHFVFARDGSLAERQIVRMPEKKILYREIYTNGGSVKALDKDGKEISTLKGSLEAADAPSLKADTKDPVVLPLPYRSREHVLEMLKIKNTAYQNLRFKDALVLLAADFAAGNSAAALEVFQQAFHGRDQRQLGFYVLLAACGQNLDADHVDVMAEHPDEPLAQYLALHSSPVLRKHASQWAVNSRQWAGAGILKHLALSHALFQRWQNDKVVKGAPAKRQAERQRALQYVKDNKGSLFGWILLCLMEDRAGKDRELFAALADAWPFFEDMGGLRYAARYERARCLWQAGKKEPARKGFRTLYDETLKKDRLPLIDMGFREALAGADKETDQWNELFHKAARRLIDRKHRPAVLALAWQCWQLEDRPLANYLLRTALENIPEKKDRLPLTLAGVRFFQETGQLASADTLLQKLLAEPKLARRAALWRLASDLAEQRDLQARSLECLEKALEAEYQRPPVVLNLQKVRQEYQKLLEQYQSLAQAMVTLKMKPPPDFLAKVVRAADRWRALDQDSSQACQLAGRILQTLGRRDLGWDYLTTPVALQPNEAAPWLELAQTLSRKGDLELADRAYTAAFEAEPTNAQLLWDRAQNLRQSGKTVAAQKLFRQLAEGKWSPRFQWLQTQARWQVERR
jgi:hypothetical protein